MKTLNLSCVLIFLLFSSGTANAVDRLFTTVKERQILDSRRYGREQTQGDETKTKTQSLHLNGVVTINQQPPKIWLNGEPTQGDGPQLKPVSNSRSVELFLPERKLHINLKPGQQLDLLTGRRLEPFNVPQKNETSELDLSDSETSEGPELLDEELGESP
ncbi:MAG: hypothetical protein AB8B48_00955 [Pseudomonadales bacterium]